MFKLRFRRRPAMLVGLSLVVCACGDGEIGGTAAGGVRDGYDEGVGPTEPAPVFQCPGTSPDVTASNGWRSVEANQPAEDVLRVELKARPTAPQLDGLLAVGAENIDNFDDAAITVRFADDGLVDVRDGAFYVSDLAYPYEPGVWYSIGILADIDSQTYDVEIGPCGEPRAKLIEDASFRDSNALWDELSTWGAWSQTASLEVSTPAWMLSGSCVPHTCQSFGRQCGLVSDGCGGTLNCGGCGSGESCSSGSCIADFAPPLAGAPSDGDYDHVIVLSSNQTSSSVVSQINSQGAGSVLVRSDTTRRTISGGMTVPRNDVTFYDLNIGNKWYFTRETQLWNVNANAFFFYAWGDTHDAHDWIVRDSILDGGGYGKQNFLLSGTSGWLIENSTLRDYLQLVPEDHTEALWIGNAKNGIIRNNQFINNGSTAHIFFSYNGGNSPGNYPNDICVEGNTFTQVVNCCYDIQTRAELPGSLNISIDPAQMPEKAFQIPPAWRRTCR